MSVTYFEYPWRGSVYAISVDETKLRKGRLVELPDGRLVKVTVPQGRFPQTEEAAATQKTYLPARVVIETTGDFQRDFVGKWEPLIEPINAAAAVNTLFSVRLTREEYQRLKSGSLAQLEEKLSERARSLIRLEEDTWNGGGPALELLRTGSCN